MFKSWYNVWRRDMKLSGLARDSFKIDLDPRFFFSQLGILRSVGKVQFFKEWLEDGPKKEQIWTKTQHMCFFLLFCW